MLVLLQIVISVIAARLIHGYTINLKESEDKSSTFQRFENSNFPIQTFVRTVKNVNEGPIAGYPKVPPPNAYESGGLADDLLPPLGNEGSQFNRRLIFKRSIDQFVLPLKTDYTIRNEPLVKITPDDKITVQTTFAPTVDTVVQKLVDPKTGYPLKAQPDWAYAGGNEEILDLPIEDDRREDEKRAVDPKTGYPLVAEPGWAHAGGNEDIIDLPLEQLQQTNEQNEAVDPKTGYPLKAQPGWAYAGGNEESLDLPLEDAQQSNEKEPVDPKTGYPLKAQPGWADAGGNEEIISLPLDDVVLNENNNNNNKVDPKTGYPLVAQENWKDAGGNGNILDLPIEDSSSIPLSINTRQSTDEITRRGTTIQPFGQVLGELKQQQPKVDPKTGYPLVAQPEWFDAGGNGDILDLPLNSSEEKGKVDPKTGYPLKAESSWAFSGGDESNIDLPFEDTGNNSDGNVIIEEQQLIELKPPSIGGDYSTEFTDNLPTSFGSTGDSSTQFTKNPPFGLQPFHQVPTTQSSLLNGSSNFNGEY